MCCTVCCLHCLVEETSWENPFPSTGAEPSAVQGAGAGAGAVDPAEVAENWTAVEDPENGTYYYNTVTELTQWDAPACLSAGAVPAPVVEEPDPTPVPEPDPVAIVAQREPSPAPAAAVAEAQSNSPALAETRKAPFSADGGATSVSAGGGGTPRGSFLDKSGGERETGGVRSRAGSALMSGGEGSGSGSRGSSPLRDESYRGSLRKQYKNSVLIVDKAALAEIAAASKGKGESIEHASARVLGQAEDTAAALMKLPYHGEPGYVDEVLRLTRECSLELYAYRHFKYPEQPEGADVAPVLAKLLSWQQDLIKTCMCRALAGSNELVSEAIFLFRHVTGYMRDRIVTVAPGGRKEKGTGAGSGAGAGGGGAEGAQGEQAIALKIIEVMLLSPSKDLYDELYCQICKQIANNPNVESTVRGWQLLNICLASFPPSTQLAPFIVHFASQHIHDYYQSNPGGEPHLNQSGSLVSRLAYNIVFYCPIALRFPAASACRKELPGSMELEALERGEGVNVRIYFIDGKYTMRNISSWTTATDVEDLIGAMLTMSKFKNLTAGAKLFSLYESTSVLSASSASGGKHHHGGKHSDARVMREEEVDTRPLDGNERLVDVLALWQRSFAELQHENDDDDEGGHEHEEHEEEATRRRRSKRAHHNQGPVPIYKFMFKRKFYFDSNQLNNNYSEDFATIELSYFEVARDVLNGHYPYTEHDAYCELSLGLGLGLGLRRLLLADGFVLFADLCCVNSSLCHSVGGTGPAARRGRLRFGARLTVLPPPGDRWSQRRWSERVARYGYQDILSDRDDVHTPPPDLAASTSALHLQIIPTPPAGPGRAGCRQFPLPLPLSWACAQEPPFDARCE